MRKGVVVGDVVALEEEVSVRVDVVVGVGW